MKPQRITLSRAKGWRMPPNTVKVDRSTKWGNPYTIEQIGVRFYVYAPHRAFVIECGSDHTARLEAVKRFRELVSLASAAQLRGKNLACWCKPGEPCHADVLLELANAEEAPG